MSLDPRFLTLPIAHRGLHGNGRPENSRAAFEAAVDHGYGIELDVQLSADAQAMVFHDYDLARLTGARGAIQMQDAEALAKLTLFGGNEGVPTLPEVLDLVAGRVPLLIEVKDQDGALGPNVGKLERKVIDAIDGYSGPLALMSFNPHSVAAMVELAPHVPRGLVTCDFSAEEWPLVPQRRLEDLRAIPDLARINASFISHDHTDLAADAVASARSEGLSILCWTIRSAEAEKEARKTADNITFESYLAPLP